MSSGNSGGGNRPIDPGTSGRAGSGDKRRDVSVLSLTTSTMLFTVGFVGMAVAFAFGLIPSAMGTKYLSTALAWSLAGGGSVLLVLGLVWSLQQAARMENNVEQEPEPKRSRELYGLYLIGAGFAFLILTLLCSLVFVGVAWSVGRLDAHKQTPAVASDPWSKANRAGEPEAAKNTPSFLRLFGIRSLGDQAGDHEVKSANSFGKLFGETPDDSRKIIGLFAISTLLASLGALFFFCNSLWSKMGESSNEIFDRRIFWGGLWFRLGEAMLFNVVFFLVIRSYAPDRDLLLPLVSLLVGMFLKSGEMLIAGIASRVFAAVQSLIPTDPAAAKAIKVLTLKLTLGGAADPAKLQQRLGELVTTLRTLPGVVDVQLDAATSTVRVEYDELRVVPDDIRRKVALGGLTEAVPT